MFKIRIVRIRVIDKTRVIGTNMYYQIEFLSLAYFLSSFFMHLSPSHETKRIKPAQKNWRSTVNCFFCIYMHPVFGKIIVVMISIQNQNHQ